MPSGELCECRRERGTKELASTVLHACVVKCEERKLLTLIIYSQLCWCRGEERIRSCLLGPNIGVRSEDVGANGEEKDLFDLSSHL